MTDWRSCDNCFHFGKICAGGFFEICITRKVSGYKPIPCKYCGGPLSEIREHNGKKFRHCYSCLMDYEV